MELPPGSSGIRRPASPGGTLSTTSSPQAQEAAGDASTLDHHSQTSDGRTRPHVASSSMGGPPDMLQASSATPAQPCTPPNDSGEGHSRILSPKTRSSEKKGPQDMPVASPSCLNQRSHVGGGDSHQRPTAERRATTLQERIWHLVNPILYLEPAPWNLPSWCTNTPFHELQGSYHGCSFEDNVGNSTDTLASRFMTNRIDGIDELRTGFGPSEGSPLSRGTLISGSFHTSSYAHHPAQVRRNDCQGAHQITTTSSTPNIARIELRRNGGAFDSLPRLSIQREVVGPPSSSYNYHLTPLSHPRRDVHDWRHFGAPKPDPRLPSQPLVLPRPPLSRIPTDPVTRRRSARHTPSTSLPVFRSLPSADSLFLAYPPEMVSFEPPGDDEPNTRGSWHDEFRRGVRRGLRQVEIDKLLSYHFHPPGNEPENIYCVVCMSDLESDELVRVLPCNHLFHASCIDEWLRRNRTCPMCRRDVTVAAPSAPKTT